VGGLVNVAFLLGNAFSIFTEAVTHLFEDQNSNLTDKTNATTLIIVASIGLLINLVGILVVSSSGSHGHSHGSSRSKGEHQTNDHSTRAVLLHLFADFFGSLAALASALILRFWTAWGGRAIVDPILSLLVVVLICISALPVLRETTHILLAKTPKDTEPGTISKEIGNLPRVASVHHLHLWQMGAKKNLASVHIHPRPGQTTPDSLHSLRREIQEILHRHSYHSSTIQFDHAIDEACEMDCGSQCGDAQCCSPLRHHNPSTTTRAPPTRAPPKTHEAMAFEMKAEGDPC
jgi:zinc transporter 1